MDQDQDSKNAKDSNCGKDQHAGAKIWSVSYTAIAVWCFALGVGGLVLFIPDYAQDRSDAFKIFIVAIFQLAIVIVVVVHAIMYYKQAAVMQGTLKHGREALEIAERAYVGVGSIVLIATRSRDVVKREMQDIILTVENLGRLPADEIRVRFTAIILVPRSIQAKYPDSLTRYYYPEWWWDFKSTKLFRGNVSFEIPVPLADKIDPILWSQVSQGNARIVAQIRIDYKDGFKSPRADYAFRLEGKWLPWWTWTNDDKEARVGEEIGRYPQY